MAFFHSGVSRVEFHFSSNQAVVRHQRQTTEILNMVNYDAISLFADDRGRTKGGWRRVKAAGTVRAFRFGVLLTARRHKFRMPEWKKAPASR
jgi:hypothetical protein